MYLSIYVSAGVAQNFYVSAGGGRDGNFAYPDKEIVRARSGQRLLADGEHVAVEHGHRIVARHDLSALLRHKLAHGFVEACGFILHVTLEKNRGLVRLPTRSKNSHVLSHVAASVQLPPIGRCVWIWVGGEGMRTHILIQGHAGITHVLGRLVVREEDGVLGAEA